MLYSLYSQLLQFLAHSKLYGLGPSRKQNSTQRVAFFLGAGRGGGCSFSSPIFCADSIWRKEINSGLGAPRINSPEAPGGSGSAQRPWVRTAEAPLGRGAPRSCSLGGKGMAPGTQPATGGSRGHTPRPPSSPALSLLLKLSTDEAMESQGQGSPEIQARGQPPAQHQGEEQERIGGVSGKHQGRGAQQKAMEQSKAISSKCNVKEIQKLNRNDCLSQRP